MFSKCKSQCLLLGIIECNCRKNCILHSRSTLFFHPILYFKRQCNPATQILSPAQFSYNFQQTSHMKQKCHIPNSTSISPHHQSSSHLIRESFSNSPSKNQAYKPSNVPVQEILTDRNEVQELINMNAAIELAESTKASLKGSNGNQNFQELKIQMKNMLMRMPYREKLDYIELLTNQGVELSQKYGYFYVTCAMIVYSPTQAKKLSLWIHPNLENTEPVHPILKGAESEKQESFIKSLRSVLNQLFPTIPLGTVNSYSRLISQIKQHQQNIKRRLDISRSYRTISYIKSQEVSASKQNEPQNTKIAEKSKQKKEMMEISSKVEQESFSSLEENIFDVLGDGHEFTMYGYNSSADTTRNNILNNVTEEFRDILQ